MKRPNILLTIADDQRAAALGCAGIDPVLTPHLDALARRGTRCSNAYHYGSPHGAVCAPSRAMLHTGLRYQDLDPRLIGMRAAGPLRIPATLGEKLRRAGYACFATGKWHNGPESFHASFNAAENVFFGGMADHWFTPVHAYDSSGRYPVEAATIAPGFSSDVFAQSAADFIRRHAGGGDGRQPFFCYCAFTAPHDPRTPPDAYRRLYDPMRIVLPPNFAKAPPFDTAAMGTRDEELLGIPRDPNAVRRNMAEYFGMITHMDACIGRIYQALADSGLLEDTIVIHTADHGLAVGQHGLLGKQNVYDHSTRVPLVVAGPAIPAGEARAGLCYQHDLHPTLLELAGAGSDSAGATPFGSLIPMLRHAASGRPHLTSHFSTNHFMVRDERYKLIERRAESSRELYDLQADPWETRNLAADPACGAALRKLTTLLRA